MDQSPTLVTTSSVVFVFTIYLRQKVAPLDVELHHGFTADPGEAGLGADQGVVEEKQVAQLPDPILNGDHCEISLEFQLRRVEIIQSILDHFQTL